MLPSSRLVTSLGPPAEFQRVIASGGRLGGRYVLLFGLPSGGALVRLGVSASGKAGTTVTRNRLKRLLREAARREAGVLGAGYDLVLIAKASAVGHGLEDIARDVRLLFDRLRSLPTGQGGATC